MMPQSLLRQVFTATSRIISPFLFQRLVSTACHLTRICKLTSCQHKNSITNITGRYYKCLNSSTFVFLCCLPNARLSRYHQQVSINTVQIQHPNAPFLSSSHQQARIFRIRRGMLSPNLAFNASPPLQNKTPVRKTFSALDSSPKPIRPMPSKCIVSHEKKILEPSGFRGIGYPSSNYLSPRSFRIEVVTSVRKRSVKCVTFVSCVVPSRIQPSVSFWRKVVIVVSRYSQKASRYFLQRRRWSGLVAVLILDPDKNHSNKTQVEKMTARKKVRGCMRPHLVHMSFGALVLEMTRLEIWKSSRQVTSTSRALGSAQLLYSATTLSASQPATLRTIPTTHPVRCFPWLQ